MQIKTIATIIKIPCMGSNLPLNKQATKVPENIGAPILPAKSIAKFFMINIPVWWRVIIYW